MEKKNRSIVKVVKKMIHDHNLPMLLWEKVSITIVYVQNRSPHQIFGDKTLEEEFIRVKPKVIHLTIFGFPICIHVPKYKRKRL
jgi:hypothetical protein